MARLAKGLSLARGPGSGSYLKGEPGWRALITFDLLIKVIYSINELGPSLSQVHGVDRSYSTLKNGGEAVFNSKSHVLHNILKQLRNFNPAL